MILKTIVSAAISLFLLGVNFTGLKTDDNNDPKAVLPSGFTETAFTGNGLSNTTAMALHPDGRIFVCQQTGELRVIKSGVVLSTPFLTLSVNSSGERGLLGVAFDPNYATNRFVYVYYTATTPAIHNRVSRFTANNANEDVAVAGSEVILLELENLNATNHNGGAIHFGPDGKLYIATGENAVPLNSQSLGNRLGKILRINSDGTIPADNPTSFPNTTGSPAGVNRAIWAVGLRNPFTFSFQPGTGRMHINDVGQNTWEEINVGAAGANYGWPTCEGTCGTAGMTTPIYQYSSAVSAPCAITGGAFYNPMTQTFPAQYIGKYFFADFCANWIKTIDPLFPPATDQAVDAFTNIHLPVDIQVASDGSLYYLARGSSSVFRVQYSGASTLAINDLTIVEGNAGTSSATFNVLLSPASSQTVTVNYSTANNSASAGTDYEAASGTLTFAPGQQSQPVSITINGDTALESNESFNVNLAGPVNATIGDGQGVGTILNDDGQPSLSINDVSVTEGISGTTTATFTVSLSATSTQTVTVNYATAGNTATSGTDFVAANGTATITPGLLSTPITVTVNSDITFEPNETFFVNLTSPTNATISDNQATGTINNDDAEPTISINNASVVEGNSGTATAGFTVSLSNPSFQAITLNYATADNTATAGSDYVAASGTLSFAPEQTSLPLNITINGDGIFEADESFNVVLSLPTNASFADNQGVGTITNDDPAPTISIDNVSIPEGNSDTTNAVFTVSLSNASGLTITVDFATEDNTAIAGTHYVNTSGTLTFNPGTTTQMIDVPVNGDTLNEAAQLSFNVNIVAAIGAFIADNQGVGTIVDDDAPVLATEEDGQRAIALNSMFFLRDPFATTNPVFFGTGLQTRVALFATNLTATPGLVVTAEAIDSQQVTHQLPVEFISSLPTFIGFTQINVKLPDGITVAGDLHVSITVNGRKSNVVLVAVTP